MPQIDAIAAYAADVAEQYGSDHAREHAYRPALKVLLSSFEDIIVVNDPKRSDFGNPDFVFLKASNRGIIRGHAEAKDIDVDLAKTVKTEQLKRYAGYDKLFLTNGLDFRFFRNGEEYQSISIGKLHEKTLTFDPSMFGRLLDEIEAYLDLPPEPIKSGKKLAQIMGAKARRLREDVYDIITENNATVRDKGSSGRVDLLKIYELMREMLVHDLTHEKFADMYAQTLVYGLFVARYSDRTPENFTRQEARDLVPKSNPFLRHFFDHIVGADFVDRLKYIVDELCEVFLVSNVQLLVQKHLRLFEVENEKDPIIHFYEDFLKEYDPAERKRMGAYYTPIPVVRFIVNQVDEILKNDFDLAEGLADDSKIFYEVEVGQDMRHNRTHKLNTKQKLEFHRVQVLDPAVGTATFLNETIKHIAKNFEGQEGRWPSYVEDNLLDRLHGFELMMAPYTIAHLKLGMTLQESGIRDLNKRLGVYLTNTLEEGIPRQQDLFSSFGLAKTVTEESDKASEIKHDRPIMVVMGNPPYSASSNNMSDFARQLTAPYKKDLNERKINLDDDYIKFIAFAESMVAKTGEGIVAMITNNSYIDGLTHRQMRKHLLQTFDKIYVLDLHGNSKKQETAPDGSKDENVFDIMQGVAIILMVKTGKSLPTDEREVYFAELFGKRQEKFNKLKNDVLWERIHPESPRYYLTNKDLSQQANYESNTISLDQLFIKRTSGIETQKDSLVVQFTKQELDRAYDAILNDEHAIRDFYGVKDSRDWTLETARKDLGNAAITDVSYRVFDTRKVLYSSTSKGVIAYPRYEVMRNLLKPNLALNVTSKNRGLSQGYCLVTELICDRHLLDSASDSMQTFPLYIYHGDGTKTPNLNQNALNIFTKQLAKEYEPENFLDYIYAVLHSPKYRKENKEFLKIDLPRITIPTSDDEFSRLVILGRQLRELHLMKSVVPNREDTSFSVPGSKEVEHIRYEEGKVWINDEQYFGNVPDQAWNFYIGGYQPAQKWLKDRKGRFLSDQDLQHYQKIIKIIVETNNIMNQINDQVI